MPDSADNFNSDPPTPPPSGDSAQAEKYIAQLIGLINHDKVQVSRTDLSKFDPSVLQDHYFIRLKDYQVEVSHSKHPQTAKDSYVMLFNNIQHLSQGAQKVILAYLHLDQSQFNRFKDAVLAQLNRQKRLEEEKRLKSALSPIDQVLEQLTNLDGLAQSSNGFHKPADLNSDTEAALP